MHRLSRSTGGGRGAGRFSKTGGCVGLKKFRSAWRSRRLLSERVIPLGNFSYSCQKDLLCKDEIDDEPYFNAPIFLENKGQIGKVDKIFGTVG